MTERRLALGLLALAAFLAPILGGQLLVDIRPIDPAFAAACTAVIAGGSETPTLSHCLVGLLVAAAVCVALARMRVIHLPSGPILGTTTVLGALLAFSLVYTQYRAISLITLGEWLTYLTAFFATAAIAGHGVGPRILVGAIVAGCSLLGAAGIWEYSLQADPNWRIFANWVNPNALAGMLVVGLFCALGLALSTRRSAALAAGAATVVIAVALLLTQSRGGFASAGVGILVFLAAAISFVRPPGESTIALCLILPLRVAAVAWAGIVLAGGSLLLLKHAGAAVACSLLVLAVAVSAAWFMGRSRGGFAVPLGRLALVLACVLFLLFSAVSGVSKRSSPTGTADNAAGLGRISTAPDQAREQSGAFRFLLWKGCLSQFRQDAAGTGIGTYRYYSTKAGLVQQTQLAHESYLQLLVEAGPLAPIALILSLALWLIQMARGARRLPSESAPLRAGVIAAVAACAVHGLFDSVLYQFGIGLTFFLLLGIGLQLAADGLSPEFIPKAGRWVAAIVAAFAVVLPAHLGFARLQASQGLGHFANTRTSVAEDPRDEQAAARQSLDEARSLAPFDGDIWYCSAWVAGSPQERLDTLQTAAALTPCPKYYRALAREQLNQNRADDAISSLGQALREDPNNLQALLQLMRLYAKSGNDDQAQKFAGSLLGVESKPYVKLRALPQIVPTETFEARVFLADRERDPAAKAALLRPAMDGWLSFLRQTYPQIRAGAESGVAEAGGGTMESAKSDLEMGQSVANSLSGLYRELDRPSDAAAADAAAAEFSGALAKLGGGIK